MPQQNKPKLEKLIYTPNVDTSKSNEHPNTFVAMVDIEMYEKQKSDKSIAIANIFEDMRIFKYETPGKSGKLIQPSKTELENTFGTTNPDVLCQFMLINGVPHGGKPV